MGGSDYSIRSAPKAAVGPEGPARDQVEVFKSLEDCVALGATSADQHGVTWEAPTRHVRVRGKIERGGLVADKTDWDNWEQQLFDKEPVGKVGPDKMKPAIDDVKVVDAMMGKAVEICKKHFGGVPAPGTVLDVYDRIMAYRINRLSVNGEYSDE
jgi:hypothetical protein